MIFLMQSPHGWRGVRQRSHHLALRFARAGHFVRWVEPRYARWLVDEPRRFIRAREERPVEGIEVLPVTLVNGEAWRAIRHYNEHRLAAELNRPLPRAASGPRVLWLYNPHEGHLARSVPHDLLVYDIMDEYKGFPWLPRGIEEEEAELLRAADWVFAGTHALCDAKRGTAEGRIECELSGVEVEHFARASGESARSTVRVPADLAPLRQRYRRLIGYAGMIDLRIDQDLLAESARRHPEYGYILLGPPAADLSRLRSASNIHLLGQKAYADLPDYYHAWDAAMIPFIENELTRHINPTKILEYAAADLPILTRALPDIDRFYAEGAFLYRTSDEFDANLKSILESAETEFFKQKIVRAREWATDRSWDAIAGRMLARVESLLQSRADTPRG